MRGALQAYRAHLAALHAEGDEYVDGFAARVTCFEGRANVSRDELRDVERPGALEPLALVPEAIGPHAVRIRAWVWHGTSSYPFRIEPRVAHLHEEDGGWRVVSAIQRGADCGFDDGLSEMEVPASIERCLASSRDTCAQAWYPDPAECPFIEVQRCLMPSRRRPATNASLSSSQPEPPRGCGGDGWCVLHPPEGPRPIRALLAVGEDDVWAVTDRSLAHFDGARWTRADEPSGELNAIERLPSGRLIALSPNRIWTRAPGESAWAVALETGEYEWLANIDVEREDEVWVSGSHGRVIRFDGRSWSVQPRVTTSSVWGVLDDPVEGTVAATAGAAIHFDGRYWEPLDTYPLVERLVHAEDGLHAIVARGEEQALLRRDERGWTDEGPLPSGTFALARSSDGWAALDRRGLWERVEGEWRLTAEPSRGEQWSTLAAVGDTLMIGGSHGVRTRRAGQWSPAPAQTVDSLELIAARSPEDVWIAGSSIVLHWDGHEMRDVTPDHARGITWLVATPEAVLAGNGGETWVREGDGWRRIGQPRILRVTRVGREVLALAEGDEYDQRLVLRWRRGRWEETLRVLTDRRAIGPIAPATLAMLENVRELDSQSRIVLHGRGSPRVLPAFELSGEPRLFVAGRDVFFVTTRAIYRLAGSRLVRHSDAPGVLSTLTGTDAEHLVAVDDRGVAHVYDEGAWRTLALPAQVTSAALIGDQLFTVGPRGLVIRTQAP